MRLLAHLLMKLFVLIVQSSVSYLFEMTIVLFPCNHAEVMAKAIKIIKAINLSGDA
jgi:hypothetical protein